MRVGEAQRIKADHLSTLRMDRIGELQSVDGYMNIALEKTEEYVNGIKRRNYGDAFVRGNNGRSSHHCPHLPTDLINAFYSHVHIGRITGASIALPSRQSRGQQSVVRHSLNILKCHWTF